MMHFSESLPCKLLEDTVGRCMLTSWAESQLGSAHFWHFLWDCPLVACRELLVCIGCNAQQICAVFCEHVALHWLFTSCYFTSRGAAPSLFFWLPELLSWIHHKWFLARFLQELIFASIPRKERWLGSWRMPSVLLSKFAASRLAVMHGSAQVGQQLSRCHATFIPTWEEERLLQGPAARSWMQEDERGIEVC